MIIVLKNGEFESLIENEIELQEKLQNELIRTNLMLAERINLLIA